MDITVLFFGITTDLVETSSLNLTVADICTVKDFKKKLKQLYPQLKNVDTYAIAVNEAYATDDLLLQKNDTVAVIPPVSGG